VLNVKGNKKGLQDSLQPFNDDTLCFLSKVKAPKISRKRMEGLIFIDTRLHPIISKESKIFKVNYAILVDVELVEGFEFAFNKNTICTLDGPFLK
jgi:hypothetical protein